MAAADKGPDQRLQDLEQKLDLIVDKLRRHVIGFDQAPARRPVNPLNPTGLLGTTQEVPGDYVEERIANAVLSILFESTVPGRHPGAANTELAALYAEFSRLPTSDARHVAFEIEIEDGNYVAVVEEHAAGVATTEAVDKYRLLCEQAETQAAALLGSDWQERHAAAIAGVVIHAAEAGWIFRIAAEVAAAEAMNLIGERLAKASVGSQVVA